jgi:hypothetical protein
VCGVVLGSTSAHLVFGSMPESWALSASALVLLHIVVAFREARALRLRHVVLATLLAAGVTITSLAPALVCFLLWQPQQRLMAVRVRWAAYCLIVGAFALGLQAVVRPQADPLEIRKYGDEGRFVEVDVPIGQRLVQLTRGLCVQNIVGFKPTVGHAWRESVVTASADYDALGRATAMTWVGLLGMAVIRLGWVGPAAPRTLLAAVVCLALAAGLHAFYGLSNMFLYSCSFTFYVLAIFAHGLRGARPVLVLAPIVAFAALLAINNIRFAAAIVALLDALGYHAG